METKSRIRVLAAICAVALCPALHAQTDNSTDAAKQADPTSKTEKGTVKKLDGTKLFGLVEITDDYTIRITNNSGITRLPIAQLDEADFQKYGFQKDRSNDGRFWYERQQALKSSHDEPNAGKNANSDEKSVAEIRLGEISAFQPLIAAYEKTLAPKKTASSASSKNSEVRSDTSDVPFKPMFSEPGLGGPLPQPFSFDNPAIQSAPGLQSVLPAPGNMGTTGSGTGILPSAP
jgi:hypothetical protein